MRYFWGILAVFCIMRLFYKGTRDRRKETIEFDRLDSLTIALIMIGVVIGLIYLTVEYW